MAVDWSATHDALALAVAEYATGGTLTVGAVTTTTLIESLANRRMVAERWGADTHYSLSLTVPSSVLTAGIPAARSLVTYRGTSMRVVDSDENASAGTVTLHLGDL